MDRHHQYPLAYEPVSFRENGKTLIFYPSLCTGCGDCVPSCTNKGLFLATGEGFPYRLCVTLSLCDLCGDCRTACPMDAIVLQPA